jgi:hypothetical protein
VDFTKAQNTRSLWHQTNDKFNPYVEKENPGPGLYELEDNNTARSPNAHQSVFDSKSLKFKPQRVLNQNVQY